MSKKQLPAVLESDEPVAAVPTPRDSAWTEMNEELRKVAVKMDKQLGEAIRDEALRRYDDGVVIARLHSQKAKYGSNAIELLAKYFGVTPNTLYNYMEVSQAFTRDFIVSQLDRPLRNGVRLEFSHFVQFARVQADEQRRIVMDQTREESLSVRALEQEISGLLQTAAVKRPTGRPPNTPKSPRAALQRCYQLSKQLKNYAAVMPDSAFVPIQEMPPDQVDESLLHNIDNAYNELESLIDELDQLQSYLDDAKRRVARVLHGRPTDEDEAFSGPAPKPAEKPKATGRTKATEPAAVRYSNRKSSPEDVEDVEDVEDEEEFPQAAVKPPVNRREPPATRGGTATRVPPKTKTGKRK